MMNHGGEAVLYGCGERFPTLEGLASFPVDWGGSDPKVSHPRPIQILDWDTPGDFPHLGFTHGLGLDPGPPKRGLREQSILIVSGFCNLGMLIESHIYM